MEQAVWQRENGGFICEAQAERYENDRRNGLRTLWFATGAVSYERQAAQTRRMPPVRPAQTPGPASGPGGTG